MRLISEGKCVDSSGNSTSPKTPQEAIFASEETEAVPTESAVFSEAVIKQSFIVRLPEKGRNVMSQPPFKKTIPELNGGHYGKNPPIFIENI